MAAILTSSVLLKSVKPWPTRLYEHCKQHIKCKLLSNCPQIKYLRLGYLSIPMSHASKHKILFRFPPISCVWEHNTCECLNDPTNCGPYWAYPTKANEHNFQYILDNVTMEMIKHYMLSINAFAPHFACIFFTAWWYFSSVLSYSVIVL